MLTPLHKLVDLALRTPEVGSVNFNILHTLLQTMLTKLELQDIEADIDIEFDLGEHSTQTTGSTSASGKDKSVAFDSESIKKDETKLKSENAKIDETVKQEKIVKNKTKSKTPYSDLTQKVDKLSQQIEILNELPSNRELFGRPKEDGERTVADMWQYMQMKKRVDANEDGVGKLMSMMADLVKDMRLSKIKLETKLIQPGDTGSFRLDVSGDKKISDQVEENQLELQIQKEMLSKVEQSISDLQNQYSTLISEMKYFVTWSVLETALDGGSNIIPRQVAASSSKKSVVSERKSKEHADSEPISQDEIVLEIAEAERSFLGAKEKDLITSRFPDMKCVDSGAKLPERIEQEEVGPSDNVLGCLESLGFMNRTYAELLKRIDDLESQPYRAKKSKRNRAEMQDDTGELAQELDVLPWLSEDDMHKMAKRSSGTLESESFATFYSSDSEFTESEHLEDDSMKNLKILNNSEFHALLDDLGSLEDKVSVIYKSVTNEQPAVAKHHVKEKMPSAKHVKERVLSATPVSERLPSLRHLKDRVSSARPGRALPAKTVTDRGPSSMSITESSSSEMLVTEDVSPAYTGIDGVSPAPSVTDGVPSVMLGTEKVPSATSITERVSSAQSVTQRVSSDMSVTPRVSSDMSVTGEVSSSTFIPEGESLTPSVMEKMSKRHGTYKVSSKHHGTDRVSSKHHGTDRVSSKQHGSDRVSSKHDTDRVSSKHGTYRVSSKHGTDGVSSKQDGIDRVSSKHGTDRVSSKHGTDGVSSKQDGIDRVSSKHGTDRVSSKHHGTDRVSFKQDGIERMSSKHHGTDMVSSAQPIRDRVSSSHHHSERENGIEKESSDQPSTERVLSRRKSTGRVPSARDDVERVSPRRRSTGGVPSARFDVERVSHRQKSIDGVPSAWPGTEKVSSAQPGTERVSSAQPGTDEVSSAQPGTERVSSAQPNTERLSSRQHDTERISSQSGTEKQSRRKVSSAMMVQKEPIKKPSGFGLKDQMTQLVCRIDEQIFFLNNKVNDLEDMFSSLRRDMLKRPQPTQTIQSPSMEDMRMTQNAMRMIKDQIDKLSLTTQDLIADNEQKTKDIKDLIDYCDTFQDLADKEYVATEIDIKADKQSLERKVSHTLFNTTTGEMNLIIKDILDKLSEAEDSYKALSEDIDGKIDRMEWSPLKEWVEEQLLELNKKLKEGTGNLMDDAAAGLRKKLLMKFNCLSCDRIVEMMPTNAIAPPPSQLSGMPARRSQRQYTTYEIDQIRRHVKSTVGKNYQNLARAIEEKEIARFRNFDFRQSLYDPQTLRQHMKDTGFSISEISDCYAQIRQCGGPHTSSLIRSFTSPTPPKLHKREDITIQGADGHIYKGASERVQLEAKLPTALKHYQQPRSQRSTGQGINKPRRWTESQYSATRPGCGQQNNPIQSHSGPQNTQSIPSSSKQNSPTLSRTGSSQKNSPLPSPHGLGYQNSPVPSNIGSDEGNSPILSHSGSGCQNSPTPSYPGSDQQNSPSNHGSNHQQNGPTPSHVGSDQQNSSTPSHVGSDQQNSPTPLRVGSDQQNGQSPSRVGSDQQNGPTPSHVESDQQNGPSPSCVELDQQNGPTPSRVESDQQNGPSPSRVGTDQQNGPSPSRVELDQQNGPTPSRVESDQQNGPSPSRVESDQQNGPSPSRVGSDQQNGPSPSHVGSDQQNGPSPSHVESDQQNSPSNHGSDQQDGPTPSLPGQDNVSDEKEK